ncbi:MAG: HAMP domain-containing sensor histidine kinase [Candidatus Sericytochromatia bacterium]
MKSKAIPLTIILGSLLLFFCLVLTILWNFILIYNYSQIKELSGTIKEQSYFQLVILGIGSFFFVVVITGVILFMVFLARQIMLNQMQTNFIDSVTHELKTPLTSIKLYIETLKKHDLPKDKKDSFLDIMLKDVDRLNTLVDHVLEASRIEHLSKHYDFKEVNLESIIKESSEIIVNRYNLSEENIEFNLEPISINSDTTALQLVFINLLDNAVKYSDKDIKILVSVSKNINGKIDIIIKDYGVGINKNELKKIFKRFYRVQDSFTNLKKGNGLGLFIVQEIVNKLKGEIKVKSEGLNKGTEFKISFPQA